MSKASQAKGNLRATLVKALEEDLHHHGSLLSYAWGKVREHDALILFDPGSTHNFNSTNLANKLGICDFEMGEVIKADEAFQGQEVSVTPLIGKLKLHIQLYVDKVCKQRGHLHIPIQAQRCNPRSTVV